MSALVSDTSVLIDIERASLEDAVGAGGLSLVVPDLLYEKELRDYGGPGWLARGLQVLSLDELATAEAQSLAHANGAVSLVDCSALILAQHRNWTLLSGDGACHGFLWVIDQLDGANIEKERLAKALEAVMSHRSCRLPQSECALRLQRLRKKQLTLATRREVSPMARTVFFSFHYRDMFRVQQVKNHNLTKGSYKEAGFFDGSLERESNDARRCRRR